MAKFFVETQCWAHWPKVLVMGRNRDDGTVECRRYVPELTCTYNGFTSYIAPGRSMYLHELSCGHVNALPGCDAPRFCIHCGAKVVYE